MNRSVKLFCFFIFFCIPGFMTSLEVDRDEVRKSDENVEFRNYSGRYNTILKVEEIRGIGKQLAGPNPLSNRVGAYGMHFTMFHYHHLSGDPSLLSADVFFMEKDANLDHVRNIRRILSGYLEARYQYDLETSDNLAFFISIYNAVHRKDYAYFQRHFTKQVWDNLFPDYVGVSTYFADWPGRTQIVIPLSESQIDTTSISDDEVIDKLREEPDKGISERKKLVETKEDEVAKKEQEIQEKQKEIKEKENEIGELNQKIDEEKKELEQQKKSLEEEKAGLEEAEKEAENIEDEEERQAKLDEISGKQDEIANEEKALEEKEQNISEMEEEKSEKEKDLHETREEAAALEEEKQKKEQEIESDKESIRQDEFELEVASDPGGVYQQLEDTKEELENKEQELAEKEKELEQREDELKQNKTDDNIYAGKLYYLKARDYIRGGHYMNDLLIINALTRQVLKSSSLSNISGTEYAVFSKGVVVVAYEGEIEDESHELVILDRDTLELTSMADAPVFWKTPIKIRNNHVYAITLDSVGYYLAKFDENLKLTAKSDVAIWEHTFISFFGDYIYLNNEKKEVIVLNAEDLTFVEKIKP